MVNEKHQVLLIEDDPSLARVYQEYLKHESYRIIASETGAEGLSEITKLIPNVILLDLKLPDMEGLDILREVKKNGLPSAVIVITADGSLNTAIEAMKLGACDYLLKPFEPESRMRIFFISPKLSGSSFDKLSQHWAT